ncbi:MAG: RNA polymerase sigma factor [Acidimicrobiales bacterium]
MTTSWGDRPSPVDDDDRVERFRRLYETNHGPIDGYCRRRLSPEAAAEAISEVFLVAWRRLDEVPDGLGTRPWLFGVARNVVANQSRADRSRRRLEERLTILPGHGHAVVATAGADEQSVDAVLAALQRLDEPDRELLRLVAWEGLPMAEVAAVLDCTVNAATIRLHRARRRLGDALDAEGVAHEHTRRAINLSDEQDPTP